MEIHRIVLYVVLVVSILFMQFGPYNNIKLFESLNSLKDGSDMVERTKLEFAVLSTFKEDVAVYDHNPTLVDSVYDYIVAEKDCLPTLNVESTEKQSTEKQVVQTQNPAPEGLSLPKSSSKP